MIHAKKDNDIVDYNQPPGPAPQKKSWKSQ